MHVLLHVSTQCFCSYVLMWETNTCGKLSKAVIGGTATFKVLVLPCPCLHQELLITSHRSIENGTLAGPETCADNTKSSAQRTTSTCCHVVASETWHRAQAEDALSHQESGTPRGTMTKLPITNAVTSRQVQLDRSMYTCKKACWRIALALYSTPHSRQLLKSVLIRGYPWKCSRDFAVSLGSFLTWCDLGDFFFGSPAMSVVALSNAWSRLAETQGNRADKLRNN